jgi:hypothetical protein
VAWGILKALSVPIKVLSHPGTLKVLRTFLKILQSQDSRKKWRGPTTPELTSFPANAGRSSFGLIINFHHVSTCLQASGIEHGTSYMIGSEAHSDGVRLTSRKGRHLSPLADSIVLNLACVEDNGHVRVKTLMSSHDWYTAIRLLNELSEGDTTDGTEVSVLI